MVFYKDIKNKQAKAAVLVDGFFKKQEYTSHINDIINIIDVRLPVLEGFIILLPIELDDFLRLYAITDYMQNFLECPVCYINSCEQKNQGEKYFMISSIRICNFTDTSKDNIEYCNELLENAKFCEVLNSYDRVMQNIKNRKEQPKDLVGGHCNPICELNHKIIIYSGYTDFIVEMCIKCGKLFIQNSSTWIENHKHMMHYYGTATTESCFTTRTIDTNDRG